MKVKLRPHLAIWKEFKIIGYPVFKRIEGLVPVGHAGLEKLMIMIEPKKELLSANEQASFTPVTEVIMEKEDIPASVLNDRRLIVEEYDEGPSPKMKRQNKGGD